MTISQNTNRRLERSPYDADAGHLIGRDPRNLTRDDFAPGELMPAAKAIRARCLDCCGHQPSEVRKCVSTSCALWAFRMTGRLPPKLKAAALGRDDDDAPTEQFQPESEAA